MQFSWSQEEAAAKAGRSLLWAQGSQTLTYWGRRVREAKGVRRFKKNPLSGLVGKCRIFVFR